MIRAVACALVLLLAGGLARAQETKAAGSDPKVEAQIEQLRKDARAGKADLVAKAMELDAAQAATFWPLYKSYETERQKQGDERLAIIKAYAAEYPSVSDVTAKALVERAIALETRRTSSKQAFVQELLKVLPAKVAARFYQIDNRIDMLIDLDIASQVPVVK